MTDPSIARFRAVVQAGLSALEARRQEVNDLNVFPVPDGDTGDNMVLTLRAVLEELDRLGQQGALDEIGRDEIVDSVARAALLGARGNSGVILSQLIRGAAEELISRPGELVDPVLVGAAMGRAADRAYASMRAPSEGTILTVMREMAHRVSSELAHGPERRLGQDASPGEQDLMLAAILEPAVDTGRDSVRRTPDLLPILRESGVVDAGGYGLVVIFSGVVAALQGTELPELEHHAPAPARPSLPQHESSTQRYCTNFVVTGRSLQDADWIGRLEALGDSVLVVGDRATLKVHVHTDVPDDAVAVFAGAGTVSHLDVADMHQQVGARHERLEAGRSTSGVLAVVPSEGIAELYRSLGVTPLVAGPTLNPSTYDLLACVHAVAAREVVVLPNSGNVLMAAERAAEISEKTVRVVPSRSLQAGLSAALAADPKRSADANLAAMSAALGHVRTGAVTAAARDDGDARFRAGEAVGFVDERLVAWGTPEQALRGVIEALAGDGAEVISCIQGDGAPLAEDAVAGMVPDDIEFEHSVGGQPNWWWLLSAE
ncbi:MAG: Dihydroxyacetone kinase-like protein, phosphatase domain / Dihydroxyacetone kinase-like protein, kinase domain [uncultured Solirubrobacteraceae bacterium]|uniref:Dihydroxyacetone kinase-like protein, phosphatase domain / Dihydroxyacetone kinase-like protein, kinase domain n=1 Tax=uncultured Solirubrobacteraceae bacterium TaxID=1162706 RepID=A0A6J4RN43_9ACTN|nr:MAG: Dihydroxyacetone kinase-like protein, phosphatase domain / Dihydroxyacetone kinase-like protein, kinase domain [uncultured Solirubrobacteraceae bacterium]